MISSAKGVLALLRETDLSILRFALHRLHELVDVFWYEISTDVTLLEELHDSVDLTDDLRQLAALIAAKVYFHLSEYSDSVSFALAAGPLFEVGKRSLFTDTILSRCIDQYVTHRQEGTAADTVDPRLEQLFTTLADQWLAEDPSYIHVKELIGFALRARRLDVLEAVLRKHLAATNSAEMLTFAFHSAQVLVSNYAFRRDLLTVLSRLYTDGLKTIDYFALAHCLLFLGDAQKMAEVIFGLLKQSDSSSSKSVALQLAFDLFEFGSQEFLSAVATALKKLSDEDAANSTASSSASAAAVTTVVVDPKFLEALRGDITTSLNVKFLYKRCGTDIHILNLLKKSLDSRNSVTHNATVIANALMNCGTTIDGFLRDNMEWLARASEWAKFTATASVGVLHKGHTQEAMNVLKPFLPNGSIDPLPYQEAGSLYALGLIHAPVGAHSDSTKGVIEYLRNALRTYSTSEQMVHGASLGIGLAGMGLHDEDLFDALFTCVSGCDAVAGEGAALAIGLVMVGSGNARVVETLKRHAMEYDQKEKTIRGLSMALAFTMMGKEDEANPLVDELNQHADPWVRLGAVYTLGLAYCGTGSISAVERLLDIAVRDVSDDVRRTAVMMIGLVTFKDPKLCVDMTRVLVDSYNAHIRYGVAMALGIAACGSAQKNVVDTLWTLKDDLVDFVRQGAFIALSLVLVQATDAAVPQVKELRSIISKKAGDRKEDTCTKFGCIIAAGILDAGGRNCTILLHKQRHNLTKSVIGMFVFSQYWFWFPYTLMLSLSMHPTCFIGLNANLDMPRYALKSNAPASAFAPPKSVLQEKKEAKSLAQQQKVVLSTTRKEAEARERKKRNSMAAALSASNLAMDESLNAAQGKAEDASGASPTTTAGAQNTTEEESFEILQNPARVTLQQLLKVTHDVDQRYKPVKPSGFGVCMLVDTLALPEGATASEELVSIDPTQRDDMAPVPEPFAWP